MAHQMNKYLQPDYPKSALITIDTQCDTLDGQPLEIPGTSQVLPQMLELLQFFRNKSWPIIHIIRLYKEDGSNAELVRKQAIEQGNPILAPGSAGCQIARELFPDQKIELQGEKLLQGGIQNISQNEVIIYKPRWGAFYHTPLETYLENISVNTLIFTGCNYPNCPRTSIYEAGERDYKIVLPIDGVSGLYERGHKEMEGIGVNLITTQQLLTTLKGLG